MNSSFPQDIIDEALVRDPSAAAAEYLAEYRSDIQSFISREVVDAITVPGRFELPPGRRNYHAWVDPSGGSGDSMTLAISHSEHAPEGEIGIIDLVGRFDRRFRLIPSPWTFATFSRDTASPRLQVTVMRARGAASAFGTTALAMR